MQQRLDRRLQQLEMVQARVDRFEESKRQEAESEEMIEVFEAFIAWRGMAQGPNESVAQALARALEISCDELLEQMEEGIGPIRKFLLDRGYLAEESKSRQDVLAAEGIRC